MIAATALMLGFSSGELQAAEQVWTPYIRLYASSDDNILFSAEDKVDDYIYFIEPGLKLDYDQELTKISADGRATVRRYQDNSELDDEIYQFDFQGDTNLTERFMIRGSYEFIKDTTLDSELDETGRIFLSEDRFSHKAVLAPRLNVTERTSIGLSGTYRDVDYDSDTMVDYSSMGVSLPVRRRLATELDTIYISPSYTYRDSDTTRSTTYSLWAGWDHETTERLTFKLAAGARYTEFEHLDTDEKDDSWGGLGDLKLKYAYETGDLSIDFQHNLLSTADGNQVEVSRVVTKLRWYLTERTGLELSGRYYHTRTESETNADTTEYVQAGPLLFYQFTRNHDVFIAYDYSREDLEDSDSAAERNRIWVGVRLSFPIF